MTAAPRPAETLNKTGTPLLRFRRKRGFVLLQQRFHCFDTHRVELRPGAGGEGRGDLGVRLVPAAVAVGEVRHGKDAGQQGDLLAPQAGAVAGTVVPLPVEA